MNNGTKRASSWSWEYLHSLLLTSDAAPLLAGGLVEPCLDIVLPVLLEVPVGDDVVVLHHFALFLSRLFYSQNPKTLAR